MPTVGELIALPKVVSSAPKFVQGRSPYNLDADLSTTEGHRFKVKARLSTAVWPIMSIVLYYVRTNRPGVVLLRVNHGHDHKNRNGQLIVGPHLHFPSSVELGFDVDAIDWTDGPPDAEPLDARFSEMGDAWEVFARRTSIEETLEARKMQEKVNALVAQRRLAI